MVNSMEDWVLALVGGAITILKHISQWEGLSHILWKIKNVPNHQSVHVLSDSSIAINIINW